ncbi:MAG: ABC-ATPase domain-containing protein [Acidobacteria bacterium]|nr:ABC-ATPase domain-containing protein [Acidobacteriota bacterium]
MKQLESILLRIDGRGYKAYKEVQGRLFSFDGFDLVVEHVQGDPYAAPSRFRALIPLVSSGLPASALRSDARRRAARDYLARAFRAASREFEELEIDAGRQTVLDRSACLIENENIDLRFRVDLPGAGRRILGRKAVSLLIGELPRIIDQTVGSAHLDLERLERHIAAVEDQVALREALDAAGLVAFVANGSLLPRRSGIDDRPLANAVLFESPQSLDVILRAPNAGDVSGMGIPRGITLIVGGGYHGKSTLLRALETGIYDHIPEDGREQVVAVENAVKLRAEDGRAVHAVDISPFISHLPGGHGTTSFSTELASGSTSQATALVEALETGASCIMLDEDTSATNFMIRDRRMQELVAKPSEPITPFVDRVRELRDDLGVSTLLVMGGSGDYFDHADLVIQMDAYRARDVTGEAREISSRIVTGRREERESDLATAPPRQLDPRSVNPERGRGRWKIQARGVDTLVFGRSDIDLRAVDQIEDPSQVRAIGWIIGRLSEEKIPACEPLPEIRRMLDRLRKGDWTWLSGRPDGDLAGPRAHEVLAALNRLRGVRFQGDPDKAE